MVYINLFMLVFLNRFFDILRINELMSIIMEIMVEIWCKRVEMKYLYVRGYYKLFDCYCIN